MAFAASLLMALQLWAAAPKDFEITLWPDGAPTKNGLEGQPETFNRGKDYPGNVSVPTLHVYPAAKPNGKAIICCPGGGYAFLSMKYEGKEMARWMNRQGITFAVLKYRMPNGHKEVPLEDGRRAMEIMRDSAARWGFDPAQVGIMGSSAGGHFAATLATMAGDDKYRPDFQILLYPVISAAEITHGGSARNLLGTNPSKEDVEKYSLQNQVNSLTPRAFIVLSADDKTVNPLNSLEYARALLANKIPVTLHMYPSGGHGWGYRDDFAYKREWTGELESWLRSF